ncbi:MAG: 1-acyl-sn-glycerol-3-phosphate acyltransferase, partial [Clostridia bacterium]|nr:1-acyl-sn-glycerol-3-phosphate acyltransferase [Clostridia bacterium]
LIHFMAKKEVLSTPILGPILKKCGVFPVDRDTNDIDAIRTAMKCLKSGEKILIFPEGTRKGEDNEVEAKTGAVRIASKMKVPIIPVCIPRRKKIFGRVTVNIGEPYYVEGSTHEDYLRLADELMDKINSMQGNKA